MHPSLQNHYHGLVNQNNVYSQNTDASMIKLSLVSMGEDAKLEQLVLKNQNDVSFNNLEGIRVYEDEAKQTLLFEHVSSNPPPNNKLSDNSIITLNFADTTDAFDDVTVPAYDRLLATPWLELYVEYMFNGGAIATSYTSIVDEVNLSYDSDGDGSFSSQVEAIGAVGEVPSDGLARDGSALVPTVTLQSTTVRLSEVDVASLRPRKVIEGMLNVPMLWLELSAGNSSINQTFIIENEFGMFSSTNRGVRKISIWRDCSQEALNDIECSTSDKVFDKNVDSFLGSAIPTNNVNQINRIEIPNIPISAGTNRYIVTYDIGLEVDVANDDANRVDAKFAGIQNVVVAGDLSNPLNSQPVLVLDNKLKINRMTATQADGTSISRISDSSSAFNFDTQIRNDYAHDIDIVSFKPIVYRGNLSGLDITDQFTVANSPGDDIQGLSISEATPEQLIANELEEIKFDVTPELLRENGQVVMDVVLSYRLNDNPTGELEGVPTTLNVIMARYPSGDGLFKSAGGVSSSEIGSPNKPIVSLLASSSLNVIRDFEFPGHINRVELLQGSVLVPFQNFHPIAQNQKIKISFENPDSIDFSSISILLNNSVEILPNTQNNSNRPTFSYEISEGAIRIHDISSDISGLNTLTISVSDSMGNQFQDFVLSFYLSESMVVDHFYVFPNPFSSSIQQNLQLGWSMTQRAQKIEFYIVSSTGRLIESIELINTPQNNSGYQLFNWNPGSRVNISNSIPPGIYIIKMIVTDQNNNTVSKVTKFAVY